MTQTQIQKQMATRTPYSKRRSTSFVAEGELDDSGIAIDASPHEHKAGSGSDKKLIHQRSASQDHRRDIVFPTNSDPLIRLRVGSKLYTAHKSVLTNGVSAFFTDLLNSSYTNTTTTPIKQHFPTTTDIDSTPSKHPTNVTTTTEIIVPLLPIDGISHLFSSFLTYLHTSLLPPTQTLLSSALLYVIAHDTETPTLQSLVISDIAQKLHTYNGNWGYHNDVAKAVEVLFAAYCECSEGFYKGLIEVLDGEGWLGVMLNVKGVRKVMGQQAGLCLMVVDYLAE